MAKVSVSLTIRYSFTGQFLHGASMFATAAHEIENSGAFEEEEQSRHRAYVVSTIIQCCAALESEISEILMHGPGHHLGSNGIEFESQDFLKPLIPALDRLPTLERYQLVLHLLRRRPLDLGTKIVYSVGVLIRLRNELIHYKSKWDSQIDAQKIFKQLKNLKLAPPPFAATNSNFFPHLCLGASLASWCVEITVAFINHFYEHLGISSPLISHGTKFDVPKPRKLK